MKRVFALMLAGILMLLAACTPAGTEQTNPTAATTTAATSPTASPASGASAPTYQEPDGIVFPITDKNISLTYFTSLGTKAAAVVTTFDDILCFQVIQETTGIDLVFQHPPMGQENEQFNLMIASGEYADVMWWNWGTVTGGVAALLEESVVIPLNDHMGGMGNLSALYDANPEAKKQASLDDGTLYMFPFFRLDPFLRAGGPIVRKDWLDKLNIAMPETLDDWYNMLTKFKNDDPNGNGLADEIPFIAQKGTGLESLASFCAPFGVIRGFFKKGDTVMFGPVEQGYYDYLATMNKWYDEGLIDPDFAGVDGMGFDAKVTSDIAGAYIGRINNTFGRYLTLMSDSPDFNLTGTTWPKGADGKSYNIRGDMVSIATGEGIAISGKNKYVDETVALFDYLYSEEGHMLMNFGVEGVSYNMIDGYPKYVDDIIANPKLGMTDALSKYCVSGFSGPMAQDRRYFEQTLTFSQQAETIDIWGTGADLTLLIPPVSFTAEESKALSAGINDINTYVEEMTVKFIMGLEPLDKFNDFVSTIKSSMGIDEYIAIYQAAYDRYQAR